MTGPPFFSLMSAGFVWTSLTGGLGSGGYEMNVLLKFVLQSMIAMAGVELLCGRELALRGKWTCTSAVTAH